MAFGLSAAAIAGIGGSIVGGAIAANGSRQAANTQAASADRATDFQREQFNRQVELNEPFRQGGLKANNRLLYLMGLDPGNGVQVETRDQIRARLAPQYQGQAGTPGTPSASTQGGRYSLENEGAGNNQGEYPGTVRAGDVGSPGFAAGGLDAAVEAEFARQQGIASSAAEKAGTDPAYGSLMRDFSMNDFQEDPGYKYRLEQGQNAIQRGAAAAGRLGSGRYLKDLTRFGQGEASQEYGRAYDRFQINRSNKLNPLQSLLGVGQSATGRIGDAGQNFANQAGNNIMSAGNARASGYVGQSNAINNAIGQGWNNYQDQQYLNRRGNGGSRSAFGGGYTVPIYENPEY